MSMTTTTRDADLARLEAKLDAVATQVETLVESQRMLADLYRTMMPIATDALSTASERLAALESKGYVDFGRELLHVVDRVVTGFTPDDVHRLGDHVVRILDVVKSVTEPEALDLAEEVAKAAEGASEKPTGVLGLLHATNSDDDVRRGLAVVLEGLRQVGQRVHAKRDTERTKLKLNPLLGAKRNLGPSKAPSTTKATPAARRSEPAAEAPQPHRPPRHMGHASAPSVVVDAPSTHDAHGVALDADGFLADPQVWSEDLAHALAHDVGIEALTERHWDVVRFVRAEFLEKNAAPNIRRITTGAGVPTKDLYALFPRAPAKTAAKIAGVKKPVGCV